MRVSVLLQITADDGTVGEARPVAVFEKATDRPEDVGLSIAEGKQLLVAAQQQIVGAQAAAWSARHRRCECCGQQRRSKGSYPIVFRTLYGDVHLPSPRLHRCNCQGDAGPATVSPLTILLPGHIAPERLYLGVTTRSVQNRTLSRRGPVLCDDARHSRRADAVEPSHLGTGFAA
jgi:hypothetical protein